MYFELAVKRGTEERKKRRRLPIRWLAVAALTLFGSSLLCWGLSPADSPATNALSPALPAAADSQAAYETREIRDIRTGHRVMADNPELADEDVPAEEITAETHRNLVFRQVETDGSLLEFELIRSLDWSERTGATVGGTVELDLAEFGVEGSAEVLDVQPCPQLEDGPGRLVTGVFRRISHNVIDVYIKGQDEPIGSTANHPFWSENRQAFVAAGELRAGEAILRANGLPGRIEHVNTTPRTQVVHNLEVNGEHVYYVSSAGVLVHNMCAKTVLRHGTDLSSADDIVRNGLNSAKARQLGGAGDFWATRSAADADIFSVANPAGGTPVKLRIDVDDKLLESLGRQGLLEMDGDVFRFKEEAFDFLNEFAKFSIE